MFKASLDLGEGPVSSTILRLAIPTMISMFFQNLYSLVDTIFVSWIGAHSLAALSLSVPITYIALGLAKGVSVGATTLMSNMRGAGEHNRVNSLAHSALPLMLMVLAPSFVLLLPTWNTEVYSVLGAVGEVQDEAYDYSIWMVLGFPIMGYTMVCESIFMSHGDSLTPMKGMLIGNLVNLVCDPLFIFKLDLGVSGASLASLCGFVVSGLYMRQQLGRGSLVCPTLKLSAGSRSNWCTIFKLGWFISLSLLVVPLSMGVVNWLLAQSGAAYVGAWNIMSRLEMMVMLPLWGAVSAFVPFVGFNLGKKNIARIRSAIRLTLIYSVAFVVIGALVIFFFEGPMLEFLDPGDEVLKWSSFAVRTAMTGWVFVPLELTLIGLSQGVKKPHIALIATAVRLLGLRIPLAFFFLDWIGVQGIYWSHPAAMLGSGAFSWILLIHLTGKLKRSVYGKK